MSAQAVFAGSLLQPSDKIWKKTTAYRVCRCSYPFLWNPSVKFKKKNCGPFFCLEWLQYYDTTTNLQAHPSATTKPKRVWTERTSTLEQDVRQLALTVADVVVDVVVDPLAALVPVGVVPEPLHTHVNSSKSASMCQGINRTSEINGRVVVHSQLLLTPWSCW